MLPRIHKDDRDASSHESRLKILKGLSVIASSSFDFEDSEQKLSVWNSVLAMLIPSPSSLTLLSDLQLLDADVRVFVSDFGVVGFTNFCHQISINFLVPDKCENYNRAFLSFVDFVSKTFCGFAICFDRVQKYIKRLPVKGYMRRFVSAKKFILGCKYIKEESKVVLNGMSLDVERVACRVEDVNGTKPLPLCCEEDNIDTLYWTKVDTGELVVFKNPHVPLIDHVSPSPFTEKREEACSVMASRVKDIFLRILKGDTFLIEDINNVSIPVTVRLVIVTRWKSLHGVSDVFLLMVAKLLTTGKVNEECTPSLHLLFAVAKLVITLSQGLRPRIVLDNLTFIIRDIREAELSEWRRWFLSSLFVRDVLKLSSLKDIEVACNRHMWILEVLFMHLSEQIGKWRSKDVAIARLVTLKLNELKMSKGSMIDLENTVSNCVVDVLEEMVKMKRESEMACQELLEQEKTNREPKKKAKKKVRRKQICKSSETAMVAERLVAEEEGNHSSACSEISSFLEEKCGGMTCSLIGSGVYTDKGDCDVVITCSDGRSLLEAYNSVARETGWKRMFNVLSDEHVGILKGEWKGIKVDAQIWRGEPVSVSEMKTESALRLTSFFLTSSDKDFVDRTRFLNSELTRAGLKDHGRCLLPGLAVTSFSALIQAKGCTSFPSVSLLIPLLYKQIPNVTISTRDVEIDGGSGEEGRADSPLIIMVDGVNCSNRMTVLTTRHVQDTLVFLSRGGVDADEWRLRSMFRCLFLRPRKDCSLPSLHSSLSKIDGNPLVDSVCVINTGTDFLLLATLSSYSDVEKYGFKDDDEVESTSDPDVVHVVRNGKRWPLLTSPLKTASAEGGVCKCIIKGGTLLPNAPFLTVDMMSCFDACLWDFKL
jgi:hypothetical protein